VGDLSKELLKAGLISEKQFRQSQHQERVKKTSVGHEGLEKEAKAKEAEAVRQREEQRRRDRERVREEQRAVDAEVTRARLKDVITHGAVRSAASGNRKYYFVTPGGRIPYLEVNDQAVRALHHHDQGTHGLNQAVAEQLYRLGGTRVIAAQQHLHIRAQSGNPKQPAPVIDKFAEFGFSKAFLMHQMQQHAGIHGATAGAHHDAIQG